LPSDSTQAPTKYLVTTFAPLQPGLFSGGYGEQSPPELYFAFSPSQLPVAELQAFTFE